MVSGLLSILEVVCVIYNVVGDGYWIFVFMELIGFIIDFFKSD